MVDEAGRRGCVADGVSIVGGLAYGWYITGAAHEGQAFIRRALAEPRNSSVEHRVVAGAWCGWLIQLGSGATADAVEYAERAVQEARGGSLRSRAPACP